ncbi:MAG TPA: dTDP-4-dehydrorhamnose reductase [Jatrophihabitantaceae bacterium]|nr:dTDP-4-dehydrorhamnose reductase [Jatrophihabitantaceae bacterium]
MTRWLVTGAGGQLGTHLLELLDGADVVAVTRAELDVTHEPSVEALIRDARPDVVLNAAAYTAVDAAEEASDDAFAGNEHGPRLLAEALARHGGRLVHVSTDYVFAGDASRPYEPDDPTGPRTVYGRSKLAGEDAVRAALPDSHVVRTAWVYGGPSANFVDTMIKLEQSRDTLDVVNDQIGSPTWVRDLAAALIALGSADVPGGVLHYVNTGQASWFELAREVFRLVGADPERVRPVSSEQFPRPAPRPAWSVLSTTSWTNRDLPAPRSWQAALAECLAAKAR